LPGSIHDRAHSAAKILIDVRQIAIGGSQTAAGHIPDTRPASRAAAVDAEKIDFGQFRSPIPY
jgi:hypothetical protein